MPSDAKLLKQCTDIPRKLNVFEIPNNIMIIFSSSNALAEELTCRNLREFVFYCVETSIFYHFGYRYWASSIDTQYRSKNRFSIDTGIDTSIDTGSPSAEDRDSRWSISVRQVKGSSVQVGTEYRVVLCEALEDPPPYHIPPPHPHSRLVVVHGCTEHAINIILQRKYTWNGIWEGTVHTIRTCLVHYLLVSRMLNRMHPQYFMGEIFNFV